MNTLTDLPKQTQSNPISKAEDALKKYHAGPAVYVLQVAALCPPLPPYFVRKFIKPVFDRFLDSSCKLTCKWAFLTSLSACVPMAYSTKVSDYEPDGLVSLGSWYPQRMVTNTLKADRVGTAPTHDLLHAHLPMYQVNLNQKKFNVPHFI